MAPRDKRKRSQTGDHDDPIGDLLIRRMTPVSAVEVQAGTRRNEPIRGDSKSARAAEMPGATESIEDALRLGLAHASKNPRGWDYAD